jgi:hypothetical protein
MTLSSFGACTTWAMWMGKRSPSTTFPRTGMASGFRTSQPNVCALKPCQPRGVGIERKEAEPGDILRCLRAGSERPSDGSVANDCDEVSSPHSFPQPLPRKCCRETLCITAKSSARLHCKPRGWADPRKPDPHIRRLRVPNMCETRGAPRDEKI